jgi:hypothetical protein
MTESPHTPGRGNPERLALSAMPGSRIVEAVTGGPYWAFKSLLVVLLFVLLFTCAPAVLVVRDLELPPAYALKADDPLADTVPLTVPENAGERSHGAKLTPRLVGSVLLWLTDGAGWHPYLPATLFGLLFLISGIVVAERITGDRIAGLLTGLLFGGLYATSACFSVNVMPKPFDGVAIGMLGAMLLALGRPWLLSLLGFLSYWTDERALPASLFIALVIVVWPSMTKRERLVRFAGLAAAGVAYVVTRIALTAALGWTFSEMSMIGIRPVYAVSSFQLAVWTAFEGGWILVACAAARMLVGKSYHRLVLFVIALGFAFFPILIVLDVCRSVAFSFPILIASLAMLKETGVGGADLRRMVMYSAGIALLAPNFDVITGVLIKWIPSYAMRLLMA